MLTFPQLTTLDCLASFGWMKANKLTSFDSTDETKNDKVGTYERVVKLKEKNPNLKVLLAVGKY